MIFQTTNGSGNPFTPTISFDIETYNKSMNIVIDSGRLISGQTYIHKEPELTLIEEYSNLRGPTILNKHGKGKKQEKYYFDAPGDYPSSYVWENSVYGLYTNTASLEYVIRVNNQYWFGALKRTNSKINKDRYKFIVDRKIDEMYTEDPDWRPAESMPEDYYIV